MRKVILNALALQTFNFFYLLPPFLEHIVKNAGHCLVFRGKEFRPRLPFSSIHKPNKVLPLVSGVVMSLDRFIQSMLDFQVRAGFLGSSPANDVFSLLLATSFLGRQTAMFE